MTFIPADEDEFFLRVAEALSGCQLIEQELKLYITEAFDLVRKRVTGQLPFKLSGDDYQDSSLEKLIGMFRKLCDNETLVQRLNKLKDERNFLSHKAITHCMDHEQGLSYPAVVELEPRLSAIASEAHALRIAIHDEANKFRGHLFFDEVKDVG
jgi:hypothetical protein